MPFNSKRPYLSPDDLTCEDGLFPDKCLKWVYQRLNAGDIPGAFKIGGVWFIDKEILTQKLKERASKPHTKVRQTGGTKSRHDLS